MLFLLLNEKFISWGTPLAPMGEKLVLTPKNYGSVRKFYVSTTMDQTVSPMLQKMMMEKT